jgi:threonylcarbamoyladenosine tRNA methylthiotransferase MtaB
MRWLQSFLFFLKGMLGGYTDNYLKVALAGDDSLIGKIVKVKITKASYPLNDGQFVRVMGGVPV